MKKLKNLIPIGLISILIIPINVFAFNKTEMIYANLNYQGNVKNIKVNTKLTNLEKGEILDYSYLTDIKNLNGDEKFSYNSREIKWKSLGKDITYQGKTNNKLPISISSKYLFNEKEVSPKDIIGKEGNIKIKYEIKNHDYNNTMNMYTPFVVSYVSILDSKNNTNISINNGKVITTGTKSIIVGVSSPGLYENTLIEEVKKLDDIEISYYTKNFKDSDNYFVMTPKLLDEVDISKLSKLEKLDRSMDTLQNGMNELEDGAYKLVDGEIKFTSGMKKLDDGIYSALNGSKKITSGLEEINKGTHKLNSLTELVTTLYNTYTENKNLIASISSGNAKEKYEEVILNTTNKKSEFENNLNEVNANISTLKEKSELTEEETTTLNELEKQKVDLEMGISNCNSAITKLELTISQLPVALAKLEGANEVVFKVLTALIDVNREEDITKDNINKFNSNLNELVNGINQVKDGSNELTSGLNKLSTGSSTLINNSKKLEYGSKKISDGIQSINNQGIKKLTAYKNKLNNYKDKIYKLKKLSKDYKGFTSNNSDNTIFIYKITN